MMKIAVIAMILILINIVASVVATADVFGSGQVSFYETEYTGTYTDISGRNISSFSEAQQFTESMNIFNVMLGSLSFNWIIQYVPTAALKEAAANTVVAGLNAFLVFLISVAVLEMFMKRHNILG